MMAAAGTNKHAYPVNTGRLFWFRFNRRFWTIAPFGRVLKRHTTEVAGCAVFCEDAQTQPDPLEIAEPVLIG
jgi:hypothetical protein